LAARLARSAPGQDTRSGQGALARRHTDGPLRAALLKTTVTCEAWRRSHDAPSSFLLQELRLFVGPKTRSLVPDTDTGIGPIPPVTVFRVKAYSGGVLPWVGSRSPDGWDQIPYRPGGWVLHQPPWSFGFDSQTRGTRENRRTLC
jgi:hypothetical protein